MRQGRGLRVQPLDRVLEHLRHLVSFCRLPTSPAGGTAAKSRPCLPGPLAYFPVCLCHQSTSRRWVAPERRRGGLRVDLNGQPVASRGFQAADSLRTRWSMPLPADQLQAGSNVLLIHAFLGSPEVSCSLPANDSIWTEVFGSSTLDAPADNGNRTELPSP